MPITKSKLKLKLENDLSKKLQFSTDFSQNFTEHPSTIALPWQQWMSHGTGLYSAQQREEPACGRIPPPPGLFRVK